MNDKEEFDAIYKDLTLSLRKLVDCAVRSDRRPKILPLLRQYIHKNISSDELAYELRKNCNLWEF